MDPWKLKEGVKRWWRKTSMWINEIAESTRQCSADHVKGEAQLSAFRLLACGEWCSPCLFLLASTVPLSSCQKCREIWGQCWDSWGKLLGQSQWPSDIIMASHREGWKNNMSWAGRKDFSIHRTEDKLRNGNTDKAPTELQCIWRQVQLLNLSS